MSAAIGHRGVLLSGSRWSPAQLAVPPKIWLDDISAVTNASGFASQWNDRSGNGSHFSQGASASRPAILPTDAGGLRALSFDGVNDCLLLSSGSGLDLYRNRGSGWVLTVYARTAIRAGSQQVFESASNSTVVRLGSGMLGDLAYTSARRLDADTAVAVIDANAKADLSYHVAYSQVDWSAAAAAVQIDGFTPTTLSPFLTAGVTSNTAALRIVLAGNAALSTFSPLKIAAVLAGAGALPSSGEREKLNGWAAWRYGLQGNLPPGHPYKNSPP